MKYSIVKNCRCCNKKAFKIFYNFGKMNLSTEFPNVKTKKNNKIPMNVKICTNCKLVQLHHNYDLNQLYNKDYGYKSGVNQTMNLHLKSIVNDIEKIIKFKKDDVVLDIASNDGTLLKKYKNQKIIRFGIDPTIKKFSSCYPKKYLKFAGFFNKKIYDLKSKSKKAKAITSIAVFYDIPDPNKFVEDVSRILHKEGVWVLEQSYFVSLFKNNAYDSLCHEHLTYFILFQLEKILEKYKLRVFDISLNSMNGGSIRFFICHKYSNFKTNYIMIKKTKKVEALYLKNINHNLKKFKKNIEKSKNNLKKLINNLITKKKKIHLYGASTKGNIILQFCNINNNQIPFAAERNRDKWRRLTPGSNIPIISEKQSRQIKPDYYLVMPWHFKKEILKREKKFLTNGGKLIFPLPSLQVVSK
jgi:hypothetical protein